METYPKIRMLCDMAGDPLTVPVNPSGADRLPALDSRHKREILYMLSAKNGFYAFDCALHVFPLLGEGGQGELDILKWNDPAGWKTEYGRAANGLFCFAEDLFGYQFCSRGGKIARFDPETGEAEDVADTVEDWAALLLSDPDVEAGRSIAREWRRGRGPIRPGHRLVPIYPFVTKEGTYELSNLYEVDALAGMLSRADFAKQIRNIADGARIKLVPRNTEVRADSGKSYPGEEGTRDRE